jgi:hypothetical protein
VTPFSEKAFVRDPMHGACTTVGRGCDTARKDKGMEPLLVPAIRWQTDSEAGSALTLLMSMREPDSRAFASVAFAMLAETRTRRKAEPFRASPSLAAPETDLGGGSGHYARRPRPRCSVLAPVSLTSLEPQASRLEKGAGGVARKRSPRPKI